MDSKRGRESARSIGIIDNLIYLTANRSLMYVGDMTNGYFVHRLEHLSCFLGGTFTLGAHMIPDAVLSADERQLHKWAGEGLTRTCGVSYLDQMSGLGPDEMSMPIVGARKWIDEIARWKLDKEEGKEAPSSPPGTGDVEVVKSSANRGYWNTWSNSYHLRPETVESLFYMYRTTRDIKWREWGYSIFQAIETKAQVRYGYSSLKGIDSGVVSYFDYMPSWFMAETLKYLYLLFDDDDSIKFEDWVMNTEAHPLPRFNWTNQEKIDFAIV